MVNMATDKVRDMLIAKATLCAIGYKHTTTTVLIGHLPCTCGQWHVVQHFRRRSNNEPAKLIGCENCGKVRLIASQPALVEDNAVK